MMPTLKAWADGATASVSPAASAATIDMRSMRILLVG
jgi:hypothetical protein